MKNSGFLKLFGMRGWILPACVLFMLASFAPMALADSYDDASTPITAAITPPR